MNNQPSSSMNNVSQLIEKYKMQNSQRYAASQDLIKPSDKVGQSPAQLTGAGQNRADAVDTSALPDKGFITLDLQKAKTLKTKQEPHKSAKPFQTSSDSKSGSSSESEAEGHRNKNGEATAGLIKQASQVSVQSADSARNKNLLSFEQDLKSMLDKPSLQQASNSEQYLKSITRYKICGEDKSFLTQDKNLYQKLVSIKSDTETKQSEAKADSNSESDSISLESVAKALSDQQSNFRYYLPNLNKTCFRCKKQGHIARNCTMPFEEICSLCMGPHNSYQCTSIACFYCGQVGHVKDQCYLYKLQSYKTARCLVCKKKGHMQDACQVLFLERFRERAELQRLKDQQRCLKCNKVGHINCNAKTAQDDVYQNFPPGQRNNHQPATARNENSNGVHEEEEDTDQASLLQSFRQYQQAYQQAYQQTVVKYLSPGI